MSAVPHWVSCHVWRRTAQHCRCLIFHVYAISKSRSAIQWICSWSIIAELIKHIPLIVYIKDESSPTIRHPFRQLHNSLLKVHFSIILKSRPQGLRRYAAQLLFHEVADGFVLWELGESYKAIAGVRTAIAIAIADWIGVDDVGYGDQEERKL